MDLCLKSEERIGMDGVSNKRQRLLHGNLGVNMDDGWNKPIFWDNILNGSHYELYWGICM